MKLRISDDLSLSADFVTSTAGIFATKGQGKSHLAQVIAEEMLASEQVIVAIDPTDVWWGLRSSADGKRDGYPILVIGGDHGDLQLEPEVGAGVRLAEAIVSERFSCVICTDGIDDTRAIRFVREVLETLYKKNRDPLHVFVDECDLFAPQQSKEQEDHRCIRALSHVVRRGRKKGIGTTLITQRPAELNASVRTMVEMLFVLGMLHNLDIDAVEKWMRLRKKKRGDNTAFALQEEMIDSLDTLQRGDAWVWAPRLQIHKRFRARTKRTFDSGATPKPGQKTLAAKRLAPVDIQRLGAAIADAAQRQKENDPTELRRQVAALRKELDRVGRGQDRAEANEKASHVENFELRARVAELEQALLISGGPADLQMLEGLVRKIDEITAQLKEVTKRVVAAPAPRGNLTNGHPAKAPAVPGWEILTKTPPAPADLKPVHLRLLSAIAWWESIGVPSPDLGGVAFIAKTSTKSSAFDNTRSRLRAAGYIDYPSSGRVQLTSSGRAIAPPPDQPPTNAALHAAILDKITPAHGRMVRVLIDAYPEELSLEEFAKHAGSSVTSSAFDNNRSWLRARGLAEYPRTGFVRATPLLFPEAL